MKRPNIIFIFADDMGYGDMACNNPNSKIPTPNLDRLAARGMRFTDAHAGSSVCTPSRYNVLTGRYAWRSRLKRGIVWEWDGALLEEDRPTIASLLRDNDYHTVCLGKWHLGWDWPTLDRRPPNETLAFGKGLPRERAAYEKNIDYSARIGGGPVDRGFDTYFGVDVPNFPPYTWFEDDHLTDIPTEKKPDEMYGHAGKMKQGWKLEEMIPAFTRRAVELVESNGPDSQKPYFLYYPLTSPHSPIVPNKQFKGKSGVSLYGDFVCEVDWIVGQIMDALDRTGTADNTLLIFTSDNGPENRTPDDEGVYERARTTGHYSLGQFRGIKRDAWEGGHREPFVASWPQVIPPGTVCDQVICLGDLMATCAQIIGAELPKNAAEDSVSFLPLLKGQTDKPTREFVVHHSMSGRFAIRKGDWVFIDSPTGDDAGIEPEWLKNERAYEPHEYPGELFNLREDLTERTNRYGDHPELVETFKTILEKVKNGREDQAYHGDTST